MTGLQRAGGELPLSQIFRSYDIRPYNSCGTPPASLSTSSAIQSLSTHGHHVADDRIICRDGARGTLNPLCLVAASDNKATRELAQSSWMATMGYCMATMLLNTALFAETGQGGHVTHSARWLLAVIELPACRCRARGWRRWGTAWLRCCRMSHYMRRRGTGAHSAHPALPFPHCQVATRELQSSWMAKMCDTLQLFA